MKANLNEFRGINFCDAANYPFLGKANKNVLIFFYLDVPTWVVFHVLAHPRLRCIEIALGTRLRFSAEIFLLDDKSIVFYFKFLRYL